MARAIKGRDLTGWVSEEWQPKMEATLYEKFTFPKPRRMTSAERRLLREDRLAERDRYDHDA